jgi:hypothetical protein
MLDFPSSPTTGQIFTAPNGSTWMWDGVKWVSTSAGAAYLPLTGGTLTGPLIQAADPVQPLGSATKQYVDAQNVRYRNRIINGDMSVDQRNGGAVIAAAGGYVIDRWTYTGQGIGNIGQLSTGGVVGNQFLFALNWATTTAHVVAAADASQFYQGIEGCNFNDAQWGTVNAQPITLEFWAYSSLTGTFAGCLQNGATTRSYVFTFSIPTANVWTKIRLNIPGDTAGTWNVAGNAAAAVLSFNLGLGSNYAHAAGVWVAGGFNTAPGAVNPVATLNATFSITGVALMVGAAAANAEPEFKKYSDNLIDCQRYYWNGQMYFGGYGIATQEIDVPIPFPTSMRASPTCVNTGNFNNNTNASGFISVANMTSMQTYVTNTGVFVINTTFTADADF